MLSQWWTVIRVYWMLFVFGNFSVWRICKNSYYFQYKTEPTLIPHNKLVEVFTCRGNSHPPAKSILWKAEKNNNRLKKQEQKKLIHFFCDDYSPRHKKRMPWLLLIFIPRSCRTESWSRQIKKYNILYFKSIYPYAIRYICFGAGNSCMCLLHETLCSLFGYSKKKWKDTKTHFMSSKVFDERSQESTK